MTYRWVDNRDQPRDRRILVSPDVDGMYWGIVEDLGDGRWFVVFPTVPNPWMSSREAAERTVECVQGIDPSEVG